MSSMLAVEPLYRPERDERGRVVRRVVDRWQVLRFRHDGRRVDRAVVASHRRRWRARLRAFLQEFFVGA
jgi:hypothetical protein